MMMITHNQNVRIIISWNLPAYFPFLYMNMKQKSQFSLLFNILKIIWIGPDLCSEFITKMITFNPFSISHWDLHLEENWKSDLCVLLFLFQRFGKKYFYKSYSWINVRNWTSSICHLSRISYIFFMFCLELLKNSNCTGRFVKFHLHISC